MSYDDSTCLQNNVDFPVRYATLREASTHETAMKYQ